MPSLASVSYFTQKLVEKLHSGMFSADPKHILLFITEHIIAVRSCIARVVKKHPLDGLGVFFPGAEIESKIDRRKGCSLKARHA